MKEIPSRIPHVMKVKYMSVKEFRELGFLQEINRQILHPAGLALEVQIGEDGTEAFGRVWDHKEDNEGMMFDEETVLAPEFNEKIQRVKDLQEQHRESREKLLGNMIQEPRPENI